LELRGPGDIEGTRQSGALNLKLASLVDDRQLVAEARLLAEELVEQDEQLELPQNAPLKLFLNLHKGKTVWSKIS
jgi:ATP-dependent DNA helicase RecG